MQIEALARFFGWPRRVSSAKPRGVILALALVPWCLQPGSAVAFPVSIFDNMLEATMLAQEADTEILPRMFGIDPTPINFTSNFSPAGGAFSYSTNSGATYAGLPLNLSANGAFDPVAHTGNWTSSGAVGSTAWTGSGSFAPDVADPNRQTVNFNAIFPLIFLDYFKNELAVTVGGTTFSTGVDTLTISGMPVLFSIDFDLIVPRLPPLGGAIWLTGLNVSDAVGNDVFALRATGSVDANGLGSFTARVVPEPETVALMLIGMVGLLSVMRLRNGRRLIA